MLQKLSLISKQPENYSVTTLSGSHSYRRIRKN